MRQYQSTENMEFVENMEYLPNLTNRLNDFTYTRTESLPDSTENEISIIHYPDFPRSSPIIPSRNNNEIRGASRRDHSSSRSTRTSDVSINMDGHATEIAQAIREMTTVINLRRTQSNKLNFYLIGCLVVAIALNYILIVIVLSST